MANLQPHFLVSRIGGYGDRVALVSPEGSWTYADLTRRIAEAGEFLRARPERVLLVGDDYGMDSVALLLAGLGEGKVLAPIGRVSGEEFESRSRACGAEGWIDGSRGIGPDAVHPISDNSGRAVSPLVSGLLERGRSGLVLFSSGITGDPKAMLHDFRQFLNAYQDRRTRSDSILLFLLFDHVGGLDTLFGGLASGVTLVSPPDRDPEGIARLIEQHRVNILPTTPTFLNLLLLAEIPRRFDLSSLRIITYGAEAMPESLLKRVREALPGVRCIQRFGTSETGVARTVTRPDTDLLIDDPGLQFKVVDGELWVKSNTQVLGYLSGDNDRFTEDGWFRTGDEVATGEDGTLRFLGRKVQAINVGGEKVFPGEVETALLKIPEVGACRAFGVQNAILGQAVGVEIVPVGSGDAARMRSLVRRYARQHLSRHKIPVEIQLVEKISMTPRGKRAIGSSS